MILTCSTFASGSTPVRTRLCRIGITKYFEEIKDDFEIYGQLEYHWKLFEKGKECLSFLAQRKLF